MVFRVEADREIRLFSAFLLLFFFNLSRLRILYSYTSKLTQNYLPWTRTYSAKLNLNQMFEVSLFLPVLKLVAHSKFRIFSSPSKVKTDNFLCKTWYLEPSIVQVRNHSNHLRPQPQGAVFTFCFQKYLVGVYSIQCFQKALG